jgi:hypothetical protein
MTKPYPMAEDELRQELRDVLRKLENYDSETIPYINTNMAIHDLLHIFNAYTTNKIIEQLEAHAAVTKGVLDPEKCMKLLADDYIKRMQALNPTRKEED